MNIVDVVVSTIISIFGSVTVVVLGLSGFLGKVWTNRLLEIDRLHYGGKLEQLRDELNRKIRRMQADLDKTIFVHRVQFETEFNALKEGWAKISRLRAAINAIRPTSDVVPIDDTEETKLQRLQRRLEELGTAYNAAGEAVYDQSPFYDAEIYAAIEELLKVARIEMTEVQIEKPFEPDWWKRGREHREQFNGQAEKVAALIRKRLASMTLYPSE